MIATPYYKPVVMGFDAGLSADASSLKATKMTVLGNDKATVQATIEFTWE